MEAIGSRSSSARSSAWRSGVTNWDLMPAMRDALRRAREAGEAEGVALRTLGGRSEGALAFGGALVRLGCLGREGALRLVAGFLRLDAMSVAE